MNIELPPLPEPIKELYVAGDHTDVPRFPCEDVYDADQMREYARAAIRALSADRGEAVAALLDAAKVVEATCVRHDGMDALAFRQLRSAIERCAATPPSPAESAECRCHEGNGARHCTIHTQADFDAQAAAPSQVRNLLAEWRRAGLPQGDYRRARWDCADDLEAALSAPSQVSDAPLAWENIETAEVEFLNNLAASPSMAQLAGMLRHCARLIAAQPQQGK